MDIETIPGVGEKTAAALSELDDPERALRDGDVAALARAPGISDGRAARIARAAIRREHGDPGGFAATPRAQEIYRDALGLVADHAVTRYAERRLETFYPSPSRSRVEEAREFAARAIDREPDDEIRGALAGVEPLESPPSVRVRDRCLATTDAETYARAQDALPEVSVEIVDDARGLADLARGYATVVALAEHLALEQRHHGVLVAPGKRRELGLPADACEVLLLAPAVLDGDGRVEPAVIRPAVDRHPVCTEFEVGERVVGEDVVTDHADGDVQVVQFGRLDLRATGVAGGRLDGGVDDGVAELIFALVGAGTTPEPSPSPRRLETDERARPRVEGVAHAPRLFALTLENVRFDSFPRKFDRPRPVLVGETNGLGLGHNKFLEGSRL